MICSKCGSSAGTNLAVKNDGHSIGVACRQCAIKVNEGAIKALLASGSRAMAGDIVARAREAMATANSSALAKFFHVSDLVDEIDRLRAEVVALQGEKDVLNVTNESHRFVIGEQEKALEKLTAEVAALQVRGAAVNILCGHKWEEAEPGCGDVKRTKNTEDIIARAREAAKWCSAADILYTTQIDTVTRLLREAADEIDRLRAEPPFPMKNGPPITWGIARQIHKAYSRLYANPKDLTHIAERGGYTWGEVGAIGEEYCRRFGAKPEGWS